MDPDVTYTKLFEAAARMAALLDLSPEWLGMDAREENYAAVREQGAEIVEHWEALNEWLKLGAHAPKAWDMRMRSRGR